MTTTWSHPHRLMTILTIVIGLLTGCASVFQDLDDKMHRKQFKSDYEAFENALAVYDEGNFEKALVQFKALSATSASEKITRKAWLGEICCHLMLANTQAQYTVAIGMWHDFGQSVPEDDWIWDLALLDPLIVRMTPNCTTQVIEIHHPPAAPIPTETEVIPVLPKDDRQLHAELFSLKKKLDQATKLRRQMDEIVAENQSLKEKIKALEAIDQSIQKKKTEISAPSE